MTLTKASRFLIAALAAALLAAAPAQARKQAPSCSDTTVQPSAANVAAVRAAVLCLHNRDRAARGLPPLKENPRLRRAAEGYSGAMVAQRFFDHVAPGGADMVDRILATGYARGGDWALGENLAWGTGELATAAEIERAWMASPGHRANILRRGFREVGIGIALGAPVAGVDPAGGGATYTAEFGVRR